MKLTSARRLPPVLLYHAVGAASIRPSHESRGLIVAAGDFEAQMSELVRRGFKTLTLDEFAAVVAGGPAPRRSVLLTFDDAYAHLNQVVTPVLERCRFTAAVFASSATLGRPNSWDPGTALEGMEVAAPEELVEMSAGPWEAGSHAYDHVDLRQVEPGRLRDQLAVARERLSLLVGAEVSDLAYPYGQNDSAVREAARAAGYRMAFTVTNGDPDDPFRLPRHLVNGEHAGLVFKLAIRPGTNAWLQLLRDAAPAPLRGSLRTVVRRFGPGAAAARPGSVREGATSPKGVSR
jgi:peptidoglycan/xylan/chitin deacetylase (PgdA/CDA1 family)